MTDIANFSGRREIVQARRTRALDLRIGGASLRSIAAALQVSAATIKKDLDFMYAQAAKEQSVKIEGLRAVELERLDRLHLRLWPLAVDQKTAPDYDAIAQLLAISDKRARLLGLNAKETREITMPPELLMLIRAKGLSANDLFQAMLQTLSEETTITMTTDVDADEHTDDA